MEIFVRQVAPLNEPVLTDATRRNSATPTSEPVCQTGNEPSELTRVEVRPRWCEDLQQLLLYADVRASPSELLLVSGFRTALTREDI